MTDTDDAITAPSTTSGPVRFTVTTPEGLQIVGIRSGSGPLVVLLHGGFQTHSSWRTGAETLVSEGFEVIAYDLRGHGESDRARDGDYSEEAHARDLRALLDSLPQPAALVGASMGGMTAFVTAASMRDVKPGICALVMVDIVPRMQQHGRDRVRQFMAARPDGFESLEEAADLVAQYLGGPRPRPGSGLAKNLQRSDDGRYHWHWDRRILERGFDGYGEDWIADMLALASTLTVPTLVLRGEHSDVVSRDGVAEFVAALPHGTAEEVHGVGHMVAATPNNPFVAAASRFLHAVMHQGPESGTA